MCYSFWYVAIAPLGVARNDVGATHIGVQIRSLEGHKRSKWLDNAVQHSNKSAILLRAVRSGQNSEEVEA